jgi:Spy/CpxP family protein refolding chaperone
MRKFLALAVGIIGFTLTSFSAGGGVCSTHYYLVEPIKLMPTLLKHQDSLGLSEEQKNKIKKLIREIKPRAVALDLRIDRLSKELRADMLSSDNDFLIKEEMEALAALKAERSMLNYRCVKSLKKILTPQQFKKLLELAGLR